MPTRKTTRKKTTTTPPKPPTPTAGNRNHLLNIPYGDLIAEATAKTHGAKYYKGHGWIYTGPHLPENLKPYAPEAYTWMQWHENHLNNTTPKGNPKPDPTTGTLTLYPEQKADVQAILTAHQAGAPEFLLANEVGTGKTAISIAAAKQIPHAKNILIVAPLGPTFGWKHHIQQMGDGGKNWCIINYESALKLLEPPTKALTTKSIKTRNRQTIQHGKPRTQWDVVISDESHNLGNPDSQRQRALDKIIAGPTGTKPAFSLRVSATAGRNITKLGYLHRGIAWATKSTIRQKFSAEEYLQWCKTNGFQVELTFGNHLTWERNERDLKLMNSILFGRKPTWGIRRLPNWEEVRRIPLPVELTPAERAAYNTQWSEFKEASERARQITTRVRNDPHASREAKHQARDAQAKGLVAQIRYRQKVGMLKAHGNARFVQQMLENDKQVAISCEFMSTVKKYQEELAALGIEAAIYTGKNRDTREQERIAFQRGEKKVIIFTPTAGFNLQAGDSSVPGATDTPRVQLCAEPRWSPDPAVQAEGRTHRNYKLAPVYYSYAVDTQDEAVITRCIQGMNDMKKLLGDKETQLRGLAQALGIALFMEQDPTE